ncbi:MAG TPA: guanylate kinase [Phycisphaerae bacterium]|nr:guanylate kinase [Phycisphaerae bacterium]HRY68425.1 guanylate kinase [Phycisphaerae bacterium]HSA27842.1 guanylate kinase [Phycisphaerae bacterium]
MGGILVCVSGPSGVGKTTVCKRLAQRLDALLSVSITTRPRRSHEVDGRDYWFISRKEFERRLEQGAVIEHAQVYGGHYYGTPAEPVIEALAAGRVVILEIEINGTIQVKRRFPDMVGVYLTAPTTEEQRSRLVGRAADSPAAVAERLSKAEQEMGQARACRAYQYFVVNQDVEKTVLELERIVQEKQRA